MMNSNINNNYNKTNISNYFINNTISKKTLNSKKNKTLKDYTLFNIV